MLKLYYARPSLYARLAWLALLEKQLSFELIPVNLRGEQFEESFLALNPFGHVPVLIDGDVCIIESMAILDYLEAKYPDPPLLPKDAIALAKVRMVQSVTLNELLPAIVRLIIEEPNSDERQYAHFRASNTLTFLDQMLGDQLYFAGEQLTVAEITSGTLVHRLPDLGVSLSASLNDWSDRLLARPSWQQMHLSSEEWQGFRRFLRAMPKLWQRRRQQRMKALSFRTS
jgi:glutathione S-transferase